tara:strand:- start:371 stop:559 length:189 start_codon:yes stop_codon:yes gene_type:complete
MRNETLIRLYVQAFDSKSNEKQTRIYKEIEKMGFSDEVLEYNSDLACDEMFSKNLRRKMMYG